jgi:DNA-binding transcriptional regulator YdaS (Cro superfamily)
MATTLLAIRSSVVDQSGAAGRDLATTGVVAIDRGALAVGTAALAAARAPGESVASIQPTT